MPSTCSKKEATSALVNEQKNYTSDPLEIHSIPEVRWFYSAFYQAWPYWLYFCDLKVDTQRTMVCCCLPEITPIKVDYQFPVQVQFDPLALLDFLKVVSDR